MKTSFDTFYSALCSYKAHYGDCKVLKRYEIADGDCRFPKECWGMKLGQRLADVRYLNIYKEHKQKLMDLGVDFKVVSPIEFDAFFAALKAYKRVHFHLKIPHKYVIPDDRDYPEDLWGMRIGAQLSWTRQLLCYKEHYQELVDLGVDFASNKFMTNPMEFDVMYEILQTYKRIHGNLNIPKRYAIAEGDTEYPEKVRGLKLGQRLVEIRHSGRFSEHKQKLIDLGVDYTNKRKAEFDVFYSALSAYKDAFGDVNVPQTYMVENGDVRFPDDTWGLTIGARLMNIRQNKTYKEHRQELIDLGVDFTNINYSNNRNQTMMERDMEYNNSIIESTFEVFYSALCAYKEHYGDVKVPTSYIIPNGSEIFPKESWGLRIGQRLGEARHGSAFIEHKQELLLLGVDFNKLKANPMEFAELYELLQTYKRIHGDLNIPKRYAIAEGDNEYPEKVRGLKLGQRLVEIRHSGRFIEHKQKLIDLGVDYTNKRKAEFDVFYSALSAYKDAFGDVNVPPTYMVENGDVRFPEDTWGLTIGARLMNIRQNKTYKEHKQELIDLGVDFTNIDCATNPTKFDVFCAAIRAYKSIHGDLKVPVKYVIAEGDVAYPEETWGMKLGAKLSAARCGNIFQEFQQTLTELGVECNNSIMESTFDVFYSALCAYKDDHSDVKVPQQYVVLDGDFMYPKETWGLNIGRSLDDARRGLIFKEHKHKLIELGVEFTSRKKRKTAERTIDSSAN